MDSLSVTVVLALLHALVLAVALILTLRPTITIFHLSLAGALVTWTIRPLLAVSEGGFMLYTARGSDWSLYNLGLVYQLIFNIFYCLGYIALFRRNIPKTPPRSAVSLSGYLLSLLLGLATVFIIIGLSGDAWLPTKRETVITVVVPGGKILFPLAVIPLSMSIALSYILYKRNRFLAILPIISITLLSLLYQRGFTLLGILVTIFLRNKYSALGYSTAFALAVTLLIAASIIRPIANVIAGSSVDVTDIFNFNVKSFLLYGHNFDGPDVWPVVIQYFEENGPLRGGSIIGIPARVLPLDLRYNLGVFVGTDIVNSYYWGRKYFDVGFGFNVGLAQDVFLNFGIWSLWIGLIPGLLTAMSDRWIINVRALDTLRVYLLGSLVFSGGFTGEPGGIIQWLAAFVVIGYIIHLMEAIIRRTSFRAATPPFIQAER